MTQHSIGSLPQRLANRVQPAPPSTCWAWTGSVNHKGYGRAWWRGATRQAHRVIREILVGEIDPALTLDHLCRNRYCVNPAHLEVVSRAENILRGDTFQGINHRKTECPSCGGAYSYAPATQRSHAYRYCRSCRNKRIREWRKRTGFRSRKRTEQKGV